MDIKDVFQNRRSVRKFKNQPISDDIINDILDAANSAPCTDTCNYDFGVFKDERIKNEIASATVGAEWVSDAPVIFVCCSNISWDIKDDDQTSYAIKGMTARYGKEVVDFLMQAKQRKSVKTLMQATPVYIAAQHIILSAVSHGLRGCLVDFIDLEKINQILHLPENITCELLVPIGYAAENATPVNAIDQDNIFYDTWDQ